MKNCKTFYEAQTASCLKEIIQPPPNPQPIPYQTKSYYVFRTKIFLRRYTEHTDIFFQSASRMQFFGVKKWCSSYVFSDTKQKNVPGKFVKSERFLTVFREHIIFNVK